MRGLHLASLALSSLWLSCYNPDIPSGKFACKEDGECPAELVCRPVSGLGLRCVTPGGAEADGMPGGADMAPLVTGCRDGNKAVQVSADVWGCRGAFGVGRAGDLCAEGYRWCGESDDARLALGEACTGLSGFFLVNQWAGDVADRAGMTYGVACERLSSPFGWQGCGREDGARTVSERQGPCTSVTTLMRCERGKGWTCEIAGMRYDGSGQGGALCCRR